LSVDAGEACAAYHDEHVRGLATKRVQVDEIWSFTYAKQKNVAKAKSTPANAGDTWAWTAIDADGKLMISWLVGGRDGSYAMAFMDDLRSRLANRVQLTSDGHKAYLVRRFRSSNHIRQPDRAYRTKCGRRDGD
jgi:hypothetical protein